MNAVDQLRDDRHRVRWSRVDCDLPGGIHHPKLQGDVGWDLECMEDTTIHPGEACDVPINLQIALPSGYYAEIRNRSSMARRGLYVDANIVDTGYRGPLFVMIRNMENSTCILSAGERVAQLLFHRVNPIWIEEVQVIDSDTERSSAGFGSTGR